MVKIAVTGAAGQIGYALLFRIASGEMFGRDVPVELSLLELESARDALAGVVMELEDCAFPLLRKVSTFSDPLKAFADIDWALLVGSVPRKAGMERSDLLKINAGVFVAQGKALAQVAKKDCRVVVVGNPCNTNAYIAKECAVGLNPRNFFAMTMLDQNRAKAQLALKAGTGYSAVSRVGIWGNHSATQFPDFMNARINDLPVDEVITDAAWLKGEFIDIVQKRGAQIIKARGLSSAASAANAIVETVRGIITPTREGDCFSAAVVSDGSYAVPAGLVFGFPLVSDGHNWRIVQQLKLDSFAKEKIAQTLSELIEEREQVTTLIRR